MRTIDGYASTDGTAFTLQFGGQYGAAVQATFGGGSVKLQRQLPDGSTYVSVGSTTDFSAAGYAAVYLSRGTYRWTIATATAVTAQLDRIPGE